MRNLFLMSLFGLFMMAATSGPSLANFSLDSPAFASANDDKEAAKLAKDAKDLAEAFHCPDGITTCYTADGTEYNDINNLPATAAGSSGSSSGSAKIVKPVHFRSF